jgi:integrase
MGMRSVSGVFRSAGQLDVYEALGAVGEKYGLLWYLGCTTGFRVSDLLKLRVQDVMGTVLTVRETKTKKERTVVLPMSCRKKIQMLKKGSKMAPDEFLFQGARKGSQMTRQDAHGQIRGTGEALGLEGLGTHSMRKTFAWNLLLKTKSFESVRVALNHQYRSTTFEYLAEGLERSLPSFSKKRIVPAEVPAIANLQSEFGRSTAEKSNDS